MNELDMKEMSDKEMKEVTGGKEIEILPKDYYEAVMMTNPVSGMSEEKSENGN